MRKSYSIIAIALFFIFALFYWSYFLILLRDPKVVEGSVVDQNNMPVTGAKVVFSAYERRLIVPIPFWPTVESNQIIESFTDQDGNFRVEYKLQILKLKTINKFGFAYTPEGYDYENSYRKQNVHVLHEIEDPRTKDIFKYTSPRTPLSNNRYYLSLHEGLLSKDKINNADIVIDFKAIEERGRHFRQKVSFTAVNGGIQGVVKLMRRAPVNDYVSEITHIESKRIDQSFAYYYNSSSANSYGIFVIKFGYDRKKGYQYIEVVSLLNKNNRDINSDWVSNTFIQKYNKTKSFGHWEPANTYPFNEQDFYFDTFRIAGINPWWLNSPPLGRSNHNIKLNEEYFYNAQNKILDNTRSNMPEMDRKILEFISKNNYTPVEILKKLYEKYYEHYMKTRSSKTIDWLINNYALPAEVLEESLIKIENGLSNLQNEYSYLNNEVEINRNTKKEDVVVIQRYRVLYNLEKKIKKRLELPKEVLDLHQF